jgi:hypothetical protein
MLPLTKFGLQGFRSFRTYQELPIRPLTLVFGPNGGGKSALLQALALSGWASRTGDFNPSDMDFASDRIWLGGLGAAGVDMREGGLRLCFGVATNKGGGGPSSSGLTWELRIDEPQVQGPPGKLKITPIRPPVGSVDSVSLLEGQELVLRASRDLRPPDYGADKGELCLRELRAGAGVLRLSSDEARLLSRMGESLRFRPSGLLPRPFLGFSAKAIAASTKSEAARQAGNSAVRKLFMLYERFASPVERFLAGLRYLGPLRAIPRGPVPLLSPEQRGGSEAWTRLSRDNELLEALNRYLGGKDWLSMPHQVAFEPYWSSTEVRDAVWNAFENPGDLGDDNYVQTLRKEFSAFLGLRKGTTDALEEWFREEVFEQLEIQRQEQARSTEFERLLHLRVVDKRTGREVPPANAGTGFSQIVPVLVELLSRNESLLLVEQPELHLHPSLQYGLADVLIDATIGDRGNCVVVETHSEHLLLRVLRRMRETTEGSLPRHLPPVRPEAVSICYVQAGSGGSQILEIGATSEGELSVACPRGFFADRGNELFSRR